MGDRNGDLPPINELTEGDVDDLDPEEWIDLIESATQRIEELIEETAKHEKTTEHEERLSEGIDHLYALREQFKMAETEARKRALLEEMDVETIAETLSSLATSELDLAEETPPEEDQ